MDKAIVLASAISDIKKQVSDITNKVSEIKKLEGPQGPKGDKGDKGDTGAPGKDGKDGKDGVDGKNGKDGVDGKDGISVVNAKVDFDGSLVLLLSDGNEIDAGKVSTEQAENIYAILKNGAASLNELLPSQVGQTGKVLTTNGSTAYWETAGGGDVSSSISSSTNNSVALFDGTTGKLIKDSDIIIDAAYQTVLVSLSPTAPNNITPAGTSDKTNTVLNGTGNIVTGSSNSSILSGVNNTIQNTSNSIISSGFNSVIEAPYSYVGAGIGGQINVSAGFNYIGVANSLTLTPLTSYTFVGYGEGSTVDAVSCFAGNIAFTTISGAFSSVVFGLGAAVTGASSTAGHIEQASMSGDYCFVGMLYGGEISGDYSGVGTTVDSYVSGNYSFIVSGQNNSISSARGFIGSGGSNTVNGDFSCILGGTNGTTRGVSFAEAYGNGASPGNYQRVTYLVRAETTDDTSTVATSDGLSASINNQVFMAENSTYFFRIDIVARRTDVDGEAAAFKIEGCIDRQVSESSVTFIGTPVKTVVGTTSSAWDVNVSEDRTNGALSVNVIGEAGKTIRWLAKVETVEVTN